MAGLLPLLSNAEGLLTGRGSLTGLGESCLGLREEGSRPGLASSGMEGLCWAHGRCDSLQQTLLSQKRQARLVGHALLSLSWGVRQML